MYVLLSCTVHNTVYCANSRTFTRRGGNTVSLSLHDTVVYGRVWGFCTVNSLGGAKYKMLGVTTQKKDASHCNDYETDLIEKVSVNPISLTQSQILPRQKFNFGSFSQRGP